MVWKREHRDRGHGDVRVVVVAMLGEMSESGGKIVPSGPVLFKISMLSAEKHGPS